ncbi:MAG: helix-turn-helix transcriptional regulator [Fluviicola sp.]|nr:helix-turn-helix transcriptional regulator [Fluviicola sp.]
MKEKNNILLEFGNVIKSHRKKCGISQEELALKAGLHRTYIGMIERGEKNLTLINIMKISSALEIKISNLFYECNL